MGFGDGVGVPTACPKSTPHMSSACVIRVGPSVEAERMTCTVIESVRRLTDESPLMKVAHNQVISDVLLILSTVRVER